MNLLKHKESKFLASDILNQLRIKLKNALHQNGYKSEIRDGMDIALCMIDMKESNVQYAGAYNPLYLIRDGQLIVKKGDRMPIGIYHKEKESFTNHMIRLKHNDNLYIFSDGFVDQLGEKSGKKFLIKNFKKLLLEIQEKPLDIQQTILNETLNKWKGKYQQVDDILVIGLKIP